MYIAGRAFQYRTPEGAIASVARGSEVKGFEDWSLRHRSTCLRTGFVHEVVSPAPVEEVRAPQAPLVQAAPDFWPCELCEGRGFKNATGLAVHRKRVHGL